MLRAAELLKDGKLLADVRAKLNLVDRELVLRDGVFTHGFYWPDEACTGIDPDDPASQCRPDIIPYTWNDSSEGLILYKLFDMPFPLKITRLDYPLFVYAYPLVFYDIRNTKSILKSDSSAN